jgi:hypothetical protein
MRYDTQDTRNGKASGWLAVVRELLVGAVSEDAVH